MQYFDINLGSTVFPHSLNIVRGQVLYSKSGMIQYVGSIILYNTPASGQVSKIHVYITARGRLFNSYQMKMHYIVKYDSKLA